MPSSIGTQLRYLFPPLLSIFGLLGRVFASLTKVWVSVDNGIAYVHTNFYNGATSTSQCEALAAATREIGERDDVKVVLLMGSEHSYGNGINLNTIEASADPQMVWQQRMFEAVTDERPHAP